MGSSRSSRQNEPLLDQQQQQVQSAIAQLGLGGIEGLNLEQLIGGLNPETSAGLFNQVVGDPARQQFSQETLPQIQQSFISQNAGSSSMANRALAQAGVDLEGKLGQAQGQFFLDQKQNDLANLFKLLGISQGTQTEQGVVTQKPSQLSEISSILGAIAPVAGAAFGGPAGAAAGTAASTALNALARR